MDNHVRNINEKMLRELVLNRIVEMKVKIIELLTEDGDKFYLTRALDNIMMNSHFFDEVKNRIREDIDKSIIDRLEQNYKYGDYSLDSGIRKKINEVVDLEVKNIN